MSIHFGFIWFWGNGWWYSLILQTCSESEYDYAEGDYNYIYTDGVYDDYYEDYSVYGENLNILWICSDNFPQILMEARTVATNHSFLQKVFFSRQYFLFSFSMLV